MCKKLSLFPMTRDQVAMVRYSSLLHGFDLLHCFVPKFRKQIAGADVSRLDGGDVAGTAITTYDRELLAKSDVIFIDYDERISQELKVYQSVISDAEEMCKEIILSNRLKQKLNTESVSWPKDPPRVEIPGEDILYEIHVPVITVSTHGFYTDQFAVELALRKHFVDLGYKVSQIGSWDAGGFYGFSDVPSFIHEPRDAYDKALQFNQFTKDIISKEQPELLIIGIPGATMKFTNQVLQGLGMLPLIIGAAVKADISVLCMHYAEYNELYFKETVDSFKFRQGTLLKFFNLANSSAMPDMTTDGAKLNYTDLDSDFVLEGIKTDVEHGDYHVFNALSSKSVEAMCQAMQDTLTGNVRYMR